MTIDFSNIPLPFLPPLFFAEVQPGTAPLAQSLRAMLIATPNTADGSGRTNTPYALSGLLAQKYGGRGGMLSHMYQRFRQNAPFAEVWGILCPPTAGATAAQGYLKVTGTPPVSGALVLRIGGRMVHIAVRKADSIAVTAAKIRNGINGIADLPVTAALHIADNARVDLTCKWKGASGNQIQIETTFWGKDDAIGSIISRYSMAGGTGMFDIASALDALNKSSFDVFASGLHGCVSVDSVSNFMQGDDGRWSPFQQAYGHWFMGYSASYATLITTGLTYNEPHVSVMGTVNSPTPEWEWAAAIGAHATAHWATPPELSRPLQTLRLEGILAPNSLADAFTTTEDQALLNAGISTYMVDEAHNVSIQRLVTMRRLNDWGDADPSWQDAVTMFQTMYFVRRMRQAITSAFPRAALSDKDMGIPGFASPSQIRDVYIHEYRAMEALGLVENSDAFASSIVVERNKVDPNRVDSLIRPDFVNQLRVVAALVQTFLQADSATTATAAA
jgi:phage tail sheath gpL-like